MTRSAIAAFLLLATVFSAARAETIVPKVPEGQATFDEYKVVVDSQETPVWQCRVSAIPFNRIWPGYQRAQEQTELAGFATWETDADVSEVTITTTRAAEDLDAIVVRPKSLGVVPRVDKEKKEITFAIPKRSPVVVEFGGDFHRCLHLLPFPIYKRPDKDAPNVRYFGPGAHNVGRVDLKSGDRVFVDAGAVVLGGFFGEGIEDVVISGPGIVDAGPFERGAVGGIFRFLDCKNITIDGIVQRDTDVWSTTLLRCDDVTIRNTKLVGLWRYNADGIDVCNSERVLVEDSFLRTFDDSLVVKGLDQGKDGAQKPSKDLTFRRNVVWCDWGRAMELGAETRAPFFENIRFEDSDIIRATHIAMDVQHGDRAVIKNVVFDNIRVEIDDFVPTPVYQNSDDHVYDPKANPNYCPELAVIIVQSTFYSGDKENGRVENVLFKDIRVDSSRVPPSSFTGLNAQSDVKGVVVENLYVGDRKIDSEESMNLRRNEFCEKVTFK